MHSTGPGVFIPVVATRTNILDGLSWKLSLVSYMHPDFGLLHVLRNTHARQADMLRADNGLCAILVKVRRGGGMGDGAPCIGYKSNNPTVNLKATSHSGGVHGSAIVAFGSVRVWPMLPRRQP